MVSPTIIFWLIVLAICENKIVYPTQYVITSCIHKGNEYPRQLCLDTYLFLSEFCICNALEQCFLSPAPLYSAEAQIKQFDLYDSLVTCELQ